MKSQKTVRSTWFGFATLIVAVMATLTSNVWAATTIVGAGATFPYPVFSKWAAEYKKSSGNIVNYQSIGSGAGIKQIVAKTVTFGASDRPMSPEELQKNGLIQFPSVMGGVVIVVNVKGIPQGSLKLNGKVLADIYLGKIKNWNDPAIAALNPGLNLPKQAISVVHRADGSGTSYLFTNYLSSVSPDWKSKVGEGTAVKWPAGIGGKGNEGVAAYVSRLSGTIGYVEYAYAKQSKLNMASLQNRDGKFVQPSPANVSAAAANAKWDKNNGFYLVLNNQPGANSWPIVGTTFIMMHRVQADPKAGQEALKFFEWSFKNGQKMATDLGYIPLPDSVTNVIRQSWKESLKNSAGQAIY